MLNNILVLYSFVLSSFFLLFLGCGVGVGVGVCLNSIYAYNCIKYASDQPWMYSHSSKHSKVQVCVCGEGGHTVCASLFTKCGPGFTVCARVTDVISGAGLG